MTSHDQSLPVMTSRSVVLVGLGQGSMVPAEGVAADLSHLE